MAQRTIGILGLGVFGQSVLEALKDQQVDLIAIDDHEEVINQYEGDLAVGIVGDFTDLDLLEAADIGNCDTVVIATGESLESSVLAVMHCKALGVETVIAKVKNQVTQQVLEKVGADLVILPEVEVGISLAKTIFFNHLVEVYQLDEDVVMVELPVPPAWIGKTVGEIAARSAHNLNIIGYREDEKGSLHSQLTPDFVWSQGQYLMGVTNNHSLADLQQLVK